MKIIAINGSPRKNWNTDLLLQKALAGAKSAGAQTELIHLYDLDYQGCRACMACNRKDGHSLGHCAANDDLKSVLEKIDQSDGLFLGSPIYFGDVSAMMRALLERLLYQYANFDGGQPFFTGHLKAAFIYTMNAPEGYFTDLYKKYADMLGWYFDYTGTVAATETLQVADYSQYHLGMFDEQQRKDRREKVFPQDMQKAYDLGISMVKTTI